MKLTVLAIKKAQPRAKSYKMSDGLGLYVLVNPKGRKLWRFNYRYNRKYKTLSLGIFPDLGLKAAREAHQTARKLLAQGRDPHLEKQLHKAVGSSAWMAGDNFQGIALEWLAQQRPIWTNSHYQTVQYRLHHYVFPTLGTRPIIEINAPELLLILRNIEQLGFYETAHRVRSVCGQVFRYATITGRAERDPSADLKEALVPVQAQSFAALTDPTAVGGLLRAISDYSGDLVTRCALQLAPLVFVRPSELRKAEWSEMRLPQAEWFIPAAKMKMRREHIVPLSRQALLILAQLYPHTGSGKYVFPCARQPSSAHRHTQAERPMSENTVNASLRRLGYTKSEMTGHGFRAMASTLLNEHGVNWDWIETQLAHCERNKVRAAYNRARYLPQRKIMMQQWADYLQALQAHQSPREAATVFNPVLKEAVCSK